MPTGDRLVALSADNTLPDLVETRIGVLAGLVAQEAVDALPESATPTEVSQAITDALAGLDAADVGAATPAQVQAVAEAVATKVEETTFLERVQDAVGAMLVSGGNLTLAYDDATGRVTITAAGTDAEVVRDTIGAAIVGVQGLTVGINDAADTITLGISGLTVSQVTGLQTALDGKADTTALAAKITGDNFGRLSVARRPSPFGGNAIPVIGFGCIPVGTTGASSQGTGFTAVTPMKAACACTDLRLVFPAWMLLVTGEATVANNLLYKVSIQVGTVTYPLSFGGVRKATVEPWGLLVSDSISVDLAKGDLFYVRVHYDTPTGATQMLKVGSVSGSVLTGINGNASGGDAADGTSTSPNSSASAPGAMTVLGSPLGAPPKVLIGVGDSITFGIGEPVFNQGGGGYLVRGVNDQTPLFITAVQGLKASTIAAKAGHSRIGTYWSLGTHASVLLGTNDIATTDTLATIQANLVAIWTALADRGLKVNACTLPPRSTTTDGWATAGAQTNDGNEAAKRVPLNNWIRAGAPLNPTTKVPVAVGTAGALVAGATGHPLWGYFDTADTVETARNSGKWLPALRTLTDAAITASTNVLTSDTAAFTSADVGRAVAVTGAGASGTVFLNSIASVTNATTAVLTNNAQTTVTGAALAIGTYTQDGVHPSIDGHKAMAAAINVAALP